MATYAITIAGSAKSIRPGWTIHESANGRGTLDCAVVSTAGTYRPALDDDIVITEDGTRIFGGKIDAEHETGLVGSGATAGIVTQISASDYNVYASRITIASDTSRSSETLKARLTWIAGLLSAQGVSLDAGQATGPTLAAATYVAGRYLEDVLNETTALASSTGSSSWAWNIDYSKVLSAKETNSGTNPAPFTVTDSNGNALGDITVEQPRSSDYANYVILLGGSGTHDVSDAFTGDGVTSTFALTYTLASTYGFVTVNGVQETLSAQGIGFDSAVFWLYYSSDNTIRRVPGAGPPAAAAAISINYVGQFPVRVTSDGGASAANVVQKIYTEPDVFDLATMQALADSYLTRDMASPKTVRYNAALSLTGIHPGQVQTITSTKRNLSGSHTITDVVTTNFAANRVQRRVTAMSTLRLPSNLRQQFQQTFGSGGVSVSSGSSAAVVTGGTTYLSSPVSLGGSDTLYRVANSYTRVPNALKYVAPATVSVRLRGSVAAKNTVNVTLRLYDETAAAAAFTGSATSTSATPTDYTTTGSVTAGHTYVLQMLSGTSNEPVTGIAHLESL